MYNISITQVSNIYFVECDSLEYNYFLFLSCATRGYLPSVFILGD